MTNPYEDDNAQYLVLRNAAGQHSLWPHSNDVPDGWTQVLGPEPRATCLEYVEAHWTDMRPIET